MVIYNPATLADADRIKSLVKAANVRIDMTAA
jgi:hypothetical protein